jgi:uncharacterized protein with PIN domain
VPVPESWPGNWPNFGRPAIRFLLDEHVDGGIARGLRRHGIDVATVSGVGLESADDPDVLAWALADGRVVVTHDDDFVRLHANGSAHAGVCYSHQRKHTVGGLLTMLLLVDACKSEAEMHGHLEYL